MGLPGPEGIEVAFVDDLSLVQDNETVGVGFLEVARQLDCLSVEVERHVVKARNRPARQRVR